MNFSLVLIRAKNGGFLVMNEGSADRGVLREVLFAGNVDECLKYMRDTMIVPGDSR